MITLIGLGSTGSKLVNILSQYEQYKTITIDSGKEIKEYKTPEEYEEKCPSFKKLFKGVKGEIFFFLSAPGNISGACLRILEQLKGNKTNVVCVHSDPVTLSSVGSLQQNLVSNVLQEYARSGLVNNLYLLDNAKIEEIIDDMPLDQYWDKINEVICYVFHTIMCLKHTKPMLESSQREEGISNIKTFGIMNEKGDINTFYNLQHTRSECYYYSYSKEIDGKNKNFLKDVKTRMADSQGDVVRSFKIFENSTSDRSIYIDISTHILQYVKID